jgi:hypothetical protein
MSLREWWKTAWEWSVIAFGGLLIGALYSGGWIFIGLLLSQFGPWGFAATATLFVANVALPFFAAQLGLGLFFTLLLGTLNWQQWGAWQWWGVALTALAVVACFLLLILTLVGERLLEVRREGTIDRYMMMELERMRMQRERRMERAESIESNAASRNYSSKDLAKLLMNLPLEPDDPDALLRILASGKFPKKAQHRADKTSVDPEPSLTTKRPVMGCPVDCTVFAPDRVARKQYALMQVFLHVPNERQQAEADAVKFDPEAKERGHKSLILDARVGTIFAFVVEIEGFKFREGKDTLLWTGRPQAATFPFDVPKGCKLGQHVGTVRISKDEMPVGRIDFQVEVVRDAALAPTQPVGKEARYYSSCFCSYAKFDKVEMLKRLQGMKAIAPDVETFVDVLDLRSGDEWNPKIFEAINKSDLFVVFWSKNACDSKWVKKESRYALKLFNQRHGRPDFRPIPIEGPPIAPVPRGLKTRHFNDSILGQIRAAELEKEASEKVKSDQQRSEA